jgi:hypothetical protein
MCEHNIRKVFRKALLRIQRAAFLPPGLQIELQPQLATDATRHAVKPATRIGTFTMGRDLTEIDDGRQLCFGPQYRADTQHQAGLSRSARCKHERETLPDNGIDEMLIRAALYIAAAVGLNGSADDEKLDTLDELGHWPGIVSASKEVKAWKRNTFSQDKRLPGCRPGSSVTRSAR